MEVLRIFLLPFRPLRRIQRSFTRMIILDLTLLKLRTCAYLSREIGAFRRQTKGLLLKDKELFDDLVATIKPKMIFCLGKLTYEVVSGVKADGFVKRLKTGSPFKTPYPLNRTIPVYGVAHCGARGQRNVGGIEPMRKAWEVMAGEFRGV